MHDDLRRRSFVTGSLLPSPNHSGVSNVCTFYVYVEKSYVSSLAHVYWDSVDQLETDWCSEAMDKLLEGEGYRVGSSWAEQTARLRSKK